MRARIGAARFGALGVAIIASLAIAEAVSAHAELVSSSPAKGETVFGSPIEIHATYSETLDPDGSSLALLDASGVRVARGGLASGGDPKAMTITDLATLPPGEYTVRSTTRSAEDGDIDRTAWSFTVVAPPPTKTLPTATPAATSEANATPAPTPSGVPTPSPSATPAPTSGSGGDVLIPIIAALALVALGGFFLMSRGRRSGTRR